MIKNLKLKSGKTNSTVLQRVQNMRSIVQIVILALLVAGLYSALWPALILFLPLALVAGNFFCGWICPFGTVQDILGKIGSLFWKRKLKMPSQIQRYAQYSRYLLMVAILLLSAIGFTDLGQINALRSFMDIATGEIIQTVAFIILLLFLVIGLFFERPFCNYFCHEGIKFGLANLTRIFMIKRNQETCVNCKQCDKACPMNIKLSDSNNVRSAQCINCFKCVAACPRENTLNYEKS